MNIIDIALASILATPAIAVIGFIIVVIIEELKGKDK